MITTDRAVFVGAHVKQSVKDALRGYAKLRNVSMSAFTSDAIEEKLKAEGVEIIEEPLNLGEPLPFEDSGAEAHP